MVSFKFFFLDDVNWPTPPTGELPIGSLALMGAGRTVLWALGGKYLIEAIWKLTG